MTETDMINKLLVDILGRAISLAKLSTKLKGKNRAIALAAHGELTRAYNTAVARLKREGIDTPLQFEITKQMRNNAFTVIDEDEFDTLLTAVYGTTTYEAIVERQEFRNKQATLIVLTNDLNSNVAKALDLILKHEVLGPRLFPVLEAMALEGIKLERVVLPKGNARKGGLVKKYLDKGYSREDAYKQAEYDIEEEDELIATKATPAKSISFDDRVSTATMTSIAAKAGIPIDELERAIKSTAPTELRQDPGDIRARQRLKMWEEQDEQSKTEST